VSFLKLTKYSKICYCFGIFVYVLSTYFRIFGEFKKTHKTSLPLVGGTLLSSLTSISRSLPSSFHPLFSYSLSFPSLPPLPILTPPIGLSST